MIAQGNTPLLSSACGVQLCTVLSLKLGLLTKQGFTLQVVVDIDGDGSFLMNCQELATAFIEKLDVKCFILNNQHLGMVVQWEDRFYKQNRAHTYLGHRVGLTTAAKRCVLDPCLDTFSVLKRTRLQHTFTSLLVCANCRTQADY